VIGGNVEGRDVEGRDIEGGDGGRSAAAFCMAGDGGKVGVLTVVGTRAVVDEGAVVGTGAGAETVVGTEDVGPGVTGADAERLDIAT